MRIVKIELAGRLNKNNIPEYFATLHRVPGNDTMTVTIIGPDSEREHIVEADSPEDVFSMAECLQFHLDGCKGTNSMIHDYYRILENFID
jgi:hypothetical protein